ncbi:MAG: right-handed parallel beta-helix repeat-containing protein [candidate division Zixibacteria bacterium]|nr:right-handed parallel beta-helix repeat-containing protein [candidate division Zixibacteria bacterium]
MRKLWIISAAVLLLGCVPLLADQSLQEVFDLSESYGEYDKYIELDPELEYIGDLEIPAGLRVYLNGHGALIQGRSYSTSIKVMGSLLDLSNCVIVDGYYGIYYDTLSAGSIHSNTVVGCRYSGISVMYQDMNFDVEIWDNIITDCVIGFLCIEDWIPVYIGYNTVYGMEMFRYAELCPD